MKGEPLMSIKLLFGRHLLVLPNLQPEFVLFVYRMQYGGICASDNFIFFNRCLSNRKSFMMDMYIYLWNHFLIIDGLNKQLSETKSESIAICFFGLPYQKLFLLENLSCKASVSSYWRGGAVDGFEKTTTWISVCIKYLFQLGPFPSWICQ